MATKKYDFDIKKEPRSQSEIVLSYDSKTKALKLTPSPRLVAIIEDTGSCPQKAMGDIQQAVYSWLHLIYQEV